MHISVQEFCGCAVRCLDGLTANITDVLISRSAWLARYAVVSLGPELGNAHVMLPLTDAERVDSRRRCLSVQLTSRDLEWAAPCDRARPLTGRQERLLSERYDWPCGWLNGVRSAPPLPALPDDPHKPITESERALENLLADGSDMQAAAPMITGFTASTTDGAEGAIETLLINIDDWRIPYLAVQVGAARAVVLPTHRLRGIDWLHKHVHLADDAKTISGGPRFRSHGPARIDLARRLEAYYGGVLAPDAARPSPEYRPTHARSTNNLVAK
ncbi:MAG: hypothetical protein IH624_17635 [Phycisphaerae bacterium]|nr:hypothetical protein [Phycisphaerae bacterium]